MPPVKKIHNSRSLPKTAGVRLQKIRPAPSFLLEAFLSNRTHETWRGYRQDLLDFSLYLGAKTPEEAVAHLLDQNQAEANALIFAYRRSLLERNLASSTVNRKLSTIRSLLKLARILGLCTYSIEIENLKVELYRDTRGPGTDGVRKMMDILKDRPDPKSCRDFAMLRLLYDLALRRTEVVSLDLSHLDLEEKALWVLGKDRNNRQRLSLPPETYTALAAWVKVRRKLSDEPGPLFLSFSPAHPKGRLSDSALYRIVRGLGEKVGLKVRPHGLRHAAITEALDVTRGDVRAVQRFSRHKSLNILLMYDDQRRDLAGEVSRLVAKSI